MDLSVALKEQVEQEISEHAQWCSPTCKTFLPQAYREARLTQRRSTEVVQENYDLCHIFR